jgi:hypothetical protein
MRKGENDLSLMTSMGEMLMKMAIITLNESFTLYPFTALEGL